MKTSFLTVQKVLRSDTLTDETFKTLVQGVNSMREFNTPKELADVLLESEEPLVWSILDKALHIGIYLSTNSEIVDGLELIHEVQGFGSGEVDTLKACFEKGPIDAGDIPSKTAASYLTDKGFTTRVVVKGEDGFLACTQKGYFAMKVLKTLNSSSEDNSDK